MSIFHDRDDGEPEEIPAVQKFGKRHPRSREALTAYEEKLLRDQESKHDDIYEEDYYG